MSKTRKLVAVIAIAVAFVGIGVGLLLRGSQEITSSFLEVLGEAATDFATLMAEDVKLKDAEVRKLKDMSFAQAAQSSWNQALWNDMQAKPYQLPWKFVYVFCPLEAEEIKYTAEGEYADYIGVPEGTPLDVVWLLDVVSARDQQIDALFRNGTYYEDIRRYSFLRPQEREILARKAPAYALTNDEWGEVITGYAPLYTQEGSYIGMLAVDMYIDEFMAHRTTTLTAMVFLFASVTLLLSGMFVFIYLRYLRVRGEELYRDPLTSTYNRRYFNEMFERSLNIRKNKDKFLVLLMMDVDLFKRVNDTYGHEQGDRCLKAIAEAICEVLKEPPNLVVRYGGEEFLAAMTVSSNREASRLIEDILSRVGALDLFDDGYRVTISGGAAVLPYADIEETNMSFVIKVADDNLYYCKNHGRNQFKMTDYSRQPREAREARGPQG